MISIAQEVFENAKAGVVTTENLKGNLKNFLHIFYA
jgi:hypothetical protein